MDERTGEHRSRALLWISIVLAGIAFPGALPFQGVENTVAVDLLRREVEERGLADRVEFRFFDGLVHNKTILVDDEFLIVGSQNLHYSAFGKDKSLTEHSLGVVDPEAVQDFRRLFDYHWERSKD